MKIKLVYLFLVLLFGFFLSFCFKSTLKAQEKGVYINEIFPDPLGADSGKEWIEFNNNSNSSVNLFNWKIKNISASGTVRIITIPEVLIDSNSFLIVADSNSITLPLNSNSKIIYLTLGSINLFNTTSKLELYNSESVLIETIEYSNTTENISWERKGPMCTDLIKHSSSNTLGTINQNNSDSCWEAQANTNNPTSYPYQNLPDSNNPVPIASYPSEPEIISYPIKEADILEYDKLIITEIYASPNSGEKEWIELYNASNKELSLIDYLVKDTNSSDEFDKSYSLSLIVKPKSYIVFETSNISLNNSGDRIGLFYKNFLIDEVKYPTISKGESYSRKVSFGEYKDEWFKTTKVSKGFENTEDKVDTVYINQLFSLPTNTTYITQGCINLVKSVMPDNFGYIQDTTGAIKFKVKDDSDLNIGDCLSFQGKVIKTTKEIYFSVESYSISNITYQPEIISMDDISKFLTLEGKRISLNGVSVKRKYTYSLLLSNDLKMKYSEDFDPEEYSSNDKLIIEGVVIRLSNIYYIYPFTVTKQSSVLGSSNSIVSYPQKQVPMLNNISSNFLENENQSFSIKVWIIYLAMWILANLIFFKNQLIKIVNKLDKFIKERVKYLNAERTSYFGKEIFHRNFSQEISKT